MSKATEQLIKQIYAKVYAEVFTAQNVSALIRNNRFPIENALTRLNISEKYNEFAKKFSVELAKRGMRGETGVWRQYFNAAKKNRHIALTLTWTQFQAQVMTNAIAHNFEMIKTIPQRMKEVLHHKYTSTLIEEVAKGSATRGTFKRLLQQHGVKQAQLIARTETAKLQTAILENRATDLGSVVYQWLASSDRRTRPSHKAMNGVVVFWKPPQGGKPLLDGMRGNAGEFPNCRCSPEPILDETDLTQSTYKIYDYRNDTIIKLTKKELLTAIQNRQL